MVDRRLNDPEYARRLIERQNATLAAQTLKAALATEGYKFALSLYGVAQDYARDDRFYRRIEVVAKQFWTGYDVAYIKGFFEFIIPMQSYTIWTYDREPQLIKNRGGFH
jgi:hypothetical protein